MFRKELYQIEDMDVVRIIDSNGRFMDIIPESGAMVYQVGLLNDRGIIRNILESDMDGEIKKNPWFRGRVLFPFNDRIPGGKYSFKGMDYELPINDIDDNSSIHGLVYNKPFSITNINLNDDSGEISLSMCIDKTDYASYPFSVTLDITYKLSKSGFSVNYSFQNRGVEPLPVALGWHPYFSLQENVDSLKLKAGGGQYVEVDESLNPTGDVLSVQGSSLDFRNSSLIGDKELDIAFNASSDGKIYLQNQTDQLEIEFDKELFPYVQLFIPPDRKSIAIEPITAATNAFNIDGIGLINLNPGQKRSGSVKISLIGLG